MLKLIFSKMTENLSIGLRVKLNREKTTCLTLDVDNQLKCKN